MARTALAYFETLLTNNWESSITDRIENVPEPQIHIAADVDVARVTQQVDDVIFVRDGGPQSLTPQSAGWNERKVESLVTIDIRTSVDRPRLEGVRDNNNEAERYGGLRGETQRILDEVRRGDKEYDLINGYEWNDLSEDMGYGFWRGTWEVRLTKVAVNIDPSP